MRAKRWVTEQVRAFKVGGGIQTGCRAGRGIQIEIRTGEGIQMGTANVCGGANRRGFSTGGVRACGAYIYFVRISGGHAKEVIVGVGVFCL